MRVFQLFKYIAQCLVFYILFLSSFALHAQYFTGPTSMGLGGTGAGSYDSASSIVINPALLVLGPHFDFSSYYVAGEFQEGANHSLYGLSLVDNGPEISFSGGLTYLRNRQRYEGLSLMSSEYMSLSVAGYFFKTMALGGSVYRLQQKVEGDKSYETWNVDLGYLMHSDLWSVGLVYYNLVSANEEVPLYTRAFSGIRFGGQYTWNQQMMYRFDITQQIQKNPGHKSKFHLGVGGPFSQFFQGRLGYEWDHLREEQFYSFGLGFMGPKLKLDYVYKKGVQGALGALHGVDFRLSL